MGRSPALKAAQEKYRKSKKRVELVISDSEKNALQKAADAAGVSLTAYIRQAVSAQMERDGAEKSGDPE